LAASRRYLDQYDPIERLDDLRQHRVVGYIQDMIFDKELDYLREVGVDTVNLASNSVAVQLNWVRNGAGVGILHDFSIPAAPGVVKVLPKDVSLTRSFYLVRHADDRRLERQNRFAAALVDGLRREVSRLEALA
jgi:DNA-binding transcriptional LysR family regulator